MYDAQHMYHTDRYVRVACMHCMHATLQHRELHTSCVQLDTCKRCMHASLAQQHGMHVVHAMLHNTAVVPGGTAWLYQRYSHARYACTGSAGTLYQHYLYMHTLPAVPAGSVDRVGSGGCGGAATGCYQPIAPLEMCTAHASLSEILFLSTSTCTTTSGVSLVWFRLCLFGS